MNKTAGREWLNKAWHHLSSGKVLYNANHYTDVIAIDLHYAIEVTLKAIFAYQNRKIVKTHDLIKLYVYIKDMIYFNDEELKLMDRVTTYHIKGSYPTRDRRDPYKKR